MGGEVFRLQAVRLTERTLSNSAYRQSYSLNGYSLSGCLPIVSHLPVFGKPNSCPTRPKAWLFYVAC